MGDSYEGTLTNKYQMQGAFAEMDDDIGWNDFELRNYDPQIGRWVQQDPYGQFASPYVGMGNDPIRGIDPSGGIYIPPVGGLSTTAAKAITLEEVIIVAGRPIMHAASGISALSKASIILHSAIATIKIINGDITAKQVGETRHEDPGKTTSDAGNGVKYNGRTDKGAVSCKDCSDPQYESDYALLIEERFNYWMNEFNLENGFKVENSRTRTTSIAEQDDGFSWRYGLANSNGSEVFVSFHLDSYIPSKSSVKALYQQDKDNETESKKVGKDITDQLSNIMEINPKPVQSFFEQGRVGKDGTIEKHLLILNKFEGKAGILIEFGNVANDANREFITRYADGIGWNVAMAVFKYLYGREPVIY
ncbi:MAG TPA: RHS repeat-associated core domain-containing protein [Chitinophagaceae bacterium]|nr:RHS repeat-associated core domain-containing protein [Chitinophagaceae bacterium]